MNKPYSQACENNKAPILDHLQRLFSDSKSVLEIASGTGQHGYYFSQAMPNLLWQYSDLPINHAGINAWIAEAKVSGIENLKAPLVLDVCQEVWPETGCDAIFSANSLHIMPWRAVQSLFGQLKNYLVSGSQLVIYGPFNYGGNYTSVSNENFDVWLQQQSSGSAIRDFESVNQLAHEAGLILQEDNEMPANNRLLIWQKK